MQNKDIEIFLEIVSSRNMTSAAEHLFLSQSVISTRMKKLEEELGYELFIRSKGVREVELTREGKEFISIANRWKALYDESEMLKSATQHMLRLAAPESVYYDFLEPLVLGILSKHPEIMLSVQIADSSGIYDMMESNIVDFGFASYESSRAGIVHTHLYDQTFCIVSYTDITTDGDAVRPAQLQPEKELQLSGGNFSSISIWRDKWFDQRSGCRIEINSPHMMVNLLRESGTWAIMPKTSAQHMRSLYGMKVFELSDPPESRKIFLLRNGNSFRHSSEAAEIFIGELKKYYSAQQPGGKTG